MNTDTFPHPPQGPLPRPLDASLDHALGAMVEARPIDTTLFKACAEDAARQSALCSGRPAEPRVLHPARQPGVLGVLAVLFVACLLVYSYFGRAMAESVNDLWSLRSRENAFDDTAAGRRRVQWVLALQYAAYVGLLLYSIVDPVPEADSPMAMRHILAMMTVAGGYYVFQLGVYNVLAYTFAPDAVAGRRWVDGFQASQGITGLVLAVPVLAMVFYPDAVTECMTAAVTVYFLGRVIFIIKGFRIFYTGYTSLVYFILYLCTLEIVPVLCILAVAGTIAR
ncbi:MAG: DUF4271 domain-containing protein [Muribaculaceae bacterium]|nr:DUF4271 domain-containing protein [Muribaculaceae bacterium]